MTSPKTPRHRVRLDKRRGFAVYDIKMIDGFDEEVQWGQALHQPRAHRWTVTRDGSDKVMFVEATSVEQFRGQLEKILDATGGTI